MSADSSCVFVRFYDDCAATRFHCRGIFGSYLLPVRVCQVTMPLRQYRVFFMFRHMEDALVHADVPIPHRYTRMELQYSFLHRQHRIPFRITDNVRLAWYLAARCAC